MFFAPSPAVALTRFRFSGRRTLRLFVLPAILLAFCALTGSRAHAAIKLTIDAKDGDKVHDIYTLTAHVESDADIDKVEFAVDGQLRFTDGSIPYAYEWDTIADTEGAHKLVITAYDSKGQSKAAELTLTIDNEIALGAEPLAKKGLAAFNAKDMDAARKFSRRALKADPVNLTANRTLASIYASDQDWDKAFSTLEKVKLADDDFDTRSRMADYRMQRATLPENAAKFAEELQAVILMRNEAADIAIKKVAAQGGDPKEHALALGDILLNSGRYPEAIMEYRKGGPTEEAPLPFVNRLGLAQILAGQHEKTLLDLRSILRLKRDDAATRAVQGLALLIQNKYTEARALVQADVDAHFPAALIVAAYADSAVAKRKEATGEAREAVRLVPNAKEAYYALAVSSEDPREAEKAFQRALSLAPLQSGPILRYAVRMALTPNAGPDRLGQAIDIVEFIQKRDPDNVNAQITKALLYMQTNRVKETEPTLTELYRKDSTSLDILATAAMFQRLLDQFGKTTAFLELIRKNHPDRYEEVARITRPLALLYYLNIKLPYRAGFFLTPDSLYPAKANVAGAL